MGFRVSGSGVKACSFVAVEAEGFKISWCEQFGYLQVCLCRLSVPGCAKRV